MAQKIYTSSLADCKAFAELFSNTCSNNKTAANVASLSGKTVACNSTGDNCTDSGTRKANTDKCSFERKLCA